MLNGTVSYLHIYVAKTCGHPGNVPHSRRIGDVFVFGSRVIFYCDTGYTLAGAQMIQCLATGQWSSAAPECTAIDCGPLDPPPNGYVVSGATRYNSIAEYRCQPGYQLKGAEMRMCQIDGNWDGNPATCETADCHSLPTLANGIVTCLSRTEERCTTKFGAQIEYQLVLYRMFNHLPY
jgi:hypothetical protein